MGAPSREGATFTKGVALIKLTDGSARHIHYGGEVPADIADESFQALLDSDSLAWPGDEVDQESDDESDAAPSGGGEGNADLSPDAATLLAWLEEEKPNADDTLAVLDAEPARAQALLDAEQARDKPRKGVVEALQEKLDDAGSE